MSKRRKADNKTMKAPVFFFLALICAYSPLAAQETFEYDIPEQEKRPPAPENPEAPPRKFRELILGMPLEDLKAALTKDGLFRFRGGRDVSFLPARKETLVETWGSTYIRRAFFQIAEDALYIMSFSLDTRQMDHYSVFTSFVKKYGEPAILNPGEAVWESEDTRVSIERPLTVKYIDKTVFNRLLEESRTRENFELLEREEFLDDF